MNDVTIIGGGIIGLATGYKLLQKNHNTKLLILEKEPELAFHQTGHNSGVIHSGIYYKPGSLKAKNCRRGVRELLAFCDSHAIPYKLCGKVIVATCAEELPRLHALYERGMKNQIPDLKLVGVNTLKDLEPHASGLEAIHSPSTGIVDFTQLAKALANQIEQQGGIIHTSTKVTGLNKHSGHCVIQTTTGDFESSRVINCAGLLSDKIASFTGTVPELRIIPFRGEYYILKPEKKHLVRSLIYPVPDPRFPFLGVHFTSKMDGSVEAGPNAVLALSREGYRRSKIDIKEFFGTLAYRGFWKMAGEYWKMGLGEQIRSVIKPLFVRELQRLIPEIRGKDLVKGGAGVRAQALARNGKLMDDFSIVQTERFIHVLNAPSPAATASFAIGDYIAKLALERIK